MAAIVRNTRDVPMFTPYPFERLPKLTRGQVHALSRLHSLFSDGKVDAALACAGSLLGTTVACEFGLPAPWSSVRASVSTAVWVELEPALATADGAAWLELPIALCEHLVDRVLGGDGLLAPAPSRPALDELSLGALTYFLARIAAALDGRFALRSIGHAAPVIGDGCIACSVAFHSGAAHATFRLYVPARLLRDVHAERPARLGLAHVPLALWADAGTLRLPLADVHSLASGDVVVLERSHLDAAGAGEVLVRVEGSACALRCASLGDRLEVVAIACTSEPAMSSGRRIAEASEARENERTGVLARDAPLELAVELARFQLTLGELERVQPGDVLVTGRRIGELVTLRAAGRAIAEGELVDVEGEIGVRITRLLAP